MTIRARTGNREWDTLCDLQEQVEALRNAVEAALDAVIWQTEEECEAARGLRPPGLTGSSFNEAAP